MSESRIYTKLGDDGSTGLLFGGRTGKDAPLIDTVGTLDEAVATLGLARAACTDADMSAHILRIQQDLFVVAADLAANPRARERLEPGVSLVTVEMISRLEALIDESVAAHPLRPAFLVPGANTTSAALDLARTVVRRGERRLVAYRAELPAGRRSATAQPLAYLNRLSDLLYVLARRSAGVDEPLSHDPVVGRPEGGPSSGTAR